jgi:hypothetical protein
MKRGNRTARRGPHPSPAFDPANTPRHDAREPMEYKL